MIHYFDSLRPGDQSIISTLPDGLVLARVIRTQHRWHQQKPYYQVIFSLLEPELVRGCHITGRLYCTPKALWRLNWFLRDFGYDPSLLESGQVDERALVGLEGVVKISCSTVRGLCMLNLDAFAPARDWSQLSGEPKPQKKKNPMRRPKAS